MRNAHVGNRARDRRGLVLVASVGILGVLSVMALAFASVMRLEARAARNFTDSVRADFVARAGIEDAIARLRSMTRDGAELPYEDGRPASWYAWRGTAGGGYKTSFPASEAGNCLDDDGDGLVDETDEGGSDDAQCAYTDWVSSAYTEAGDTYTLRVQDAASKVNVNAGDNLGTILDNLCRVVGSPLRAAEEHALVPHWVARQYRNLSSAHSGADEATTEDLFYRLDAHGRPLQAPSGVAVYGDGYAIAGYRARHGAFHSVDDIRNALTWVERADGDGDGEVEADTPEERMEIEAKVAALRPYVTIDSWCDTDQVGYGKFEHVVANAAGHAIRLVDRNRTWNTSRNDGAGELAGCCVSIVNGVGQGQLKTIARNTIDTIVLDNSAFPGSEMQIPPNHESSYVIVGQDHRTGAAATDWYAQARLYAKCPLSIHRAPVNVNTATDKVLVSLLLGLQTNWGVAGYYANKQLRAVAADWYALCPSVVSVGRDGYNALFTFDLPCPNDSTLASRLRDQNLARHGHARGGPPYCFFCNRGACAHGGQPGRVGEAHYLAWQILKEREQTRDQDERADTPREKHANGYGPFKGWDDLYFRVFRPWERGDADELSCVQPPLDGDIPRARAGGSSQVATVGRGGACGHTGVARLCMANFNSNTDVLKFQPNLEWVNRWGANFTDLYMPYPEHLGDEDVKLRVRPGELLDKTDLNVGTTEFCFDAGGVYEVESIGRVRDERGVAAEKKLFALVRIYDVWRESTQREFVMGDISRAAGAPGSATAGQYAVDGVTPRTPGGASPERKTLCTYPEPAVPAGMRTGAGAAPDLTLGLGKHGTAAGYDGQIMLATNMLCDPLAGTVGDVSFYDGFTGDLDADYAAGSPTPKGARQPLDEVGLLGAPDSLEYDMPPVRGTGGEIVEGEGRGGDVRPDGVYLGIVGAQQLDGSITFDTGANWPASGGAITMWVKPTWHHGTMMRATLPVAYDTVGFEKGSTVPMRRHYEYAGGRGGDCRRKWPCAHQTYRSGAERDTIGYVRDRFEHEFLNAATPGAGWGAHAFRFAKAGDIANSIGDGDCEMGRHGKTYSVPFGSLMFDYDDQCRGRTGILDFASWVPGWLYPDSRPYYRMCPFRWFFTGILWNHAVRGRNPIADTHSNNEGRREMKVYCHHIFGQPLEIAIEAGLPDATGAWTTGVNLDQDGDDISAPITPYGDHKGRTASQNLTLALYARPFIDTMRSFHRTPALVDDRGAGTYYGTRPGTAGFYDLEDWAYEHYGTMLNGCVTGGMGAAVPPEFGINRASLEGGHVYQKARSGTYATVDELAIHRTWADPRTSDGFDWPREVRRAGRYYFDRTGRARPRFTSQSLYASERAQAYTFAAGERDAVIELGTVRWTVFTPYYCIHHPGVGEFEFPYDHYFLESVRLTNQDTPVTQSTRPGPAEWERGAASRNSSQRGCTVSILTGRSGFPAEEHYEHVDPEAWSPILARGHATRHARSTPDELKYVVRFGFSREEYRRATTDAVLLDSPVLDDVTITYMRRPKVLVWREVSE